MIGILWHSRNCCWMRCRDRTWQLRLSSQGSPRPSRELLACEVDQESKQSPMERAEVAAAVCERLERIAKGEDGPRP